MESALQYQITYEYNRTALPSNVTDAETNRITAAWDIMQIEVHWEYSLSLIFIVQWFVVKLDLTITRPLVQLGVGALSTIYSLNGWLLVDT